MSDDFHIFGPDDWGAKPPKARTIDIGTDNIGVVIHHTAVAQDLERQPEVSLRAHQKYHQLTKKWNDIAYNFCISADGRVWAGRGLYAQSGATKQMNRKTWAICFLGNFEEQFLTPEMIASFVELRHWILKIYPQANQVFTHQYTKMNICSCGSTQCPGKNVAQNPEVMTQLTAAPVIELPKNVDPDFQKDRVMLPGSQARLRAEMNAGLAKVGEGLAELQSVADRLP